MNNITLTDIDGNKYKADIIFTYFDYTYGKDYVVYMIDNDLLASSYEKVNNNYIINNDLSTGEYDMIDKIIERKMGELNA